MTSQEFTRLFFEKLKSRKYLIGVVTLLFAGLLGAAALLSPKQYTSKTIIFPLTGSRENLSGASALTALFSGTDISNNFTENSSVNIIELALSRSIREQVAALKDTGSGKTFAEILIENTNKNKGLFSKKMQMPGDSASLIALGADILGKRISATINKNNSFVFTFTDYDPQTVRMISYGFVDHISDYYIELNREKAKRDFEFATSKADSLREVMNSKDNRIISIDEKNLFTNPSKMQYRLPTENLVTDKQMIRQQYATAIANQQNAAYKLQKDTPVMKVLDAPEPPYDVQKRSALVFGIIGLIVGLLAGVLLATYRVIATYTKQEVSKAIYGS